MRIYSKKLLCPAAGLLGLALFVQTATSQDKPAAPAGPDMAAMAEMMKMGAPGPQHAALKRMAGKFSAEVSMKMTPDAPAINSQGETINEMILNGRYLKGSFTGSAMGMPFKGIETVGYDNMKKKYVSVWVDDMSTMMMYSEGTADTTGKVITYTGEAPCMADGGKIKPYRNVITITDDDHHQMEMYSRGPDDKEFLTMSIKYTRVK